ncbi:hypothetical protein [Myceligenerans salitolerans]|uniref:Uncharacterized protein n=1 Tax=Myceligenerans salitolerans TaxID=1230528 RepID=A0ABS3I5V1_9MICO|nr:hypothetical protein [Myceligenerans salitolerans]MBO0608382.1 hypothetical protein [Myceligenerans salitolerans]
MDVPELLDLTWRQRLSSELAGRGWQVIELGDVTVYEKPVVECRRRFVADILRQSGRIVVLPKVGIRFPAVSDVVGRLMGEERPGTSTVGIDLIHLVKRVDGGADATRWMVSGIDQVSPVVEGLVGDLEDFGELFYGEFSSLDLLLTNYRRYSLTVPQLLDLAVGFMIRERLDEASEVLAAVLADDTTVDERIRRTIGALQEKMHSEGG